MVCLFVLLLKNVFLFFDSPPFSIHLQPKTDGFGSLPWESNLEGGVFFPGKSVPSTTSGTTPQPASSAVAATSTVAPNIHLLTEMRYRYTCTAIRSRHHPYDDRRRRGWRQRPRHPARVLVDDCGVECEVPSACDRVLGFARRRRGRGGRESLDRGWTALDDSGLWDRVSSMMDREEEDVKEATSFSPAAAGANAVVQGASTMTTSTTHHKKSEARFPNGLPKTAELTTMDAEDW